MDPHNDKEFCSRSASGYWGQVDLYVGGTEHAVGHLLYSRMWTKCLYDLGHIGFDEPFKKLLNQGMMQGSSRFAYRMAYVIKGANNEMNPIYISKKYYDSFLGKSGVVDVEIESAIRNNLNHDIDISFGYTLNPIHVDVNIVDGVELDIPGFKKWRPEYANAEFILEDGKYICGAEVEKMSKRYFNVVNPNDIVNKYGADTFRMYEMFLGPVEQSKPWDTKGIEGVHRFLKKLWRLFYDEEKGRVWTEDKATEAELKILHKAIKKVEEDTERFSFNTAVSALMIAVNELNDLKCHKREILEKILIVLAPYAPHICEELWHLAGNKETILNAPYPAFEPKYLVESTKNYPIAINGKTRAELNIALDATQEQVEEMVLSDETVRKWLDGKPPKRVIYVKNKMINVVI
jgi:leucyl-tRNA synthetase